jgi:hypothetical protein
VLLLPEVLGWSAAETAQLMDASQASVNSALQHDLLERYVQSWEAGDIDGFVGLLKHGALARNCCSRTRLAPTGNRAVGPNRASTDAGH